MTDIEQMGGRLDNPEQEADLARLTGEAPVAAMQAYTEDVRSYTHGSGQLNLVVAGYRPEPRAADVIADAAYQPTADLANTPDSVFCAHGAGYPVAWDAVPTAAHVDYQTPPL